MGLEKSYWESRPLHPEVHELAMGSYKSMTTPTIEENKEIMDIPSKADRKPLLKKFIHNSGYCVVSLQAALWAFYTFDTFEEGALTVCFITRVATTIIYCLLAASTNVMRDQFNLYPFLYN